MAKDEEFDIRKDKRRDEDAEMDITPMIDITFLLLAFFVMVSKMDPQMAVALPEAQFGTNVPDKNCVVLVVVAGDTPDSYLIFKGRSKDPEDQVAEGEETDQEAEIADYVENEFSSHPKLEAVLIKGEGQVLTKAIEVAKRGAGGSELARSRKLFVGVESKN
ncbi:biopolymer transporter ExbD [bacterium]|nr:biopolymer transporter ExbD [bacterium]